MYEKKYKNREPNLLEYLVNLQIQKISYGVGFFKLKIDFDKYFFRCRYISDEIF